MNPLCIYHGGCPDGFGAAWVVWKKHNGQVDFHYGVYNEPPPDVTGRDVWLVDFSYKRPVMQTAFKYAKSLVILDHHQSSEQDLAGLDRFYTELREEHGFTMPEIHLMFDKSKSGAVLTWEHCFPDKPLPELLAYIQDRDLWTKKLPNNEEFYVALRSYPQDFELWNTLTIPQLISEGIHIRRFYNEIKKELIKNAYELQIDGHKIPVVNAPWLYASDIAGDLAEGKPFAACYWDTPTGTVFSLRSKPEGEDVAKIAERLGGGGHKHASGFTAKKGIFESIEKKED